MDEYVPADLEACVMSAECGYKRCARRNDDAAGNCCRTISYQAQSLDNDVQGPADQLTRVPGVPMADVPGRRRPRGRCGGYGQHAGQRPRGRDGDRHCLMTT